MKRCFLLFALRAMLAVVAAAPFIVFGSAPEPALTPPQVPIPTSAAEVPGPAPGTAMSKEYVRMVGRISYVWGWPLVNNANRHKVFSEAPEPGLLGGVLPVAHNGLAMLTNYVSPEQRFVTCTNQDVVYGFGFCDNLDKEPIVFQVPVFGDRFWVFAFYDARTDEFSQIGKQYGTKPGFYMIVGPNWKGDTPRGIKAVLRSSTSVVAAAPRVFMDDTPEDHKAIQLALSQINIYPLSKFDGKVKTTDWSKLPDFPAPKRTGKGETQWVNPETFFDELPEVMKQVPPLPGEEGMYKWIGSVLDASDKDPEIKKTLKETAVVAERELIDPYFLWRNNGRAAGNGWNSPVNNAKWGTDYTNRTGTAKSNMYDNLPEETKYIYTDDDSEGKQLDGRNSYTVTFPKGQTPPVKGFWSLTLYNNVHFFNPNDLNRFSLGTKNKDLKYNADGSLTLYASAKSPGKDKESNWLPAPNGTFSLYMRAYWADKAIVEGAWLPPKVAIIGKAEAPGGKEEASATRFDVLADLPFAEGRPTQATAQTLRDELLFQRATQTYLWAMPLINTLGMQVGSEKVFGAGYNVLPIWKKRLDVKTLVTTPNSDVIYAMSYVDLGKDGPLVMEAPPQLQGILLDYWQRPIPVDGGKFFGDVGLAGPDQGMGGKFLILPPGYKGELPEGYFVYRSGTNNVFIFLRGFFKDSKNLEPAVAHLEKTRIYPLNGEAKPMKFPDASGVPANMLPISDGSAFAQLKLLVDRESDDLGGPDWLGMLAAIGIVKDQPFTPDARTREILDRAAKTGYKTSRVIGFEEIVGGISYRVYPDRRWINPMADGTPAKPTGAVNLSWMNTAGGFLALDARINFFTNYYSVSPGMLSFTPGKGANYLMAFTDSKGAPLSGGGNYRLRLPPKIPAEIFWSVTLYDAANSSGLANGQPFPSLGSRDEPAQNDDGSTDLYFGPEAPKGKDANWRASVPGKGYFIILRLYGPTKASFDKSWEPGDVEKVK